MTRETFPVLWQVYGENRKQFEALGCPKSVPWSLVAPHERQAVSNHSQTLERLAQRGGLCPVELVAVLEGKDLSWMMETSSIEQIPRLLELLEKETES